MRKGSLLIRMEFDVPVTAEMYKSAFDGAIENITPADIIEIEIGNLRANLDSYYEMLQAHVSSFSFDFREEE